MAQTRIRPEQVRLDLDWNITGHVSVGEDGIIAATRLLDIDGVTTGFGAVLTPSMAIDSPLFYGLYTRLETEVAAITVTDAISLFVEDPIKGAGSTMTNLYGLCIEDLTQGTARNWAICIRGNNPIVWGGDTSLARVGANILGTPDSFQATRVFTGDGLVGSPAHSFISDVDVGMYRIGVNDLGFTTNSTLALELNAVQQALVTNGTAAAPGFAFISDPDTGLYRLGANRLGIATAGAFAVEVDAAGNVGIGKVPDVTLHTVLGDGVDPAYLANITVAVFQNNDDNSDGAAITIIGGETTGWSGVFFGDSAFDRDGQIYYDHATRAMSFVTATAVRMTIDVAGNIILPIHKGQDFAQNAAAWDDAYADDWHNVADLYLLDRMDDLAVICGIKPGGEIDPRTGLPLIDDKSLPEWVFTKDKRGKEVLYDPDGRPYLSVKMLTSLSFGAIRQLKEWVERLEAQIGA